MRIAACLLAAALAGCGHANLRIDAGAAPTGALPVPGASVQSGSFGLRIQGGATLAALLGIGVIGAAVAGDAGPASRHAPPMDEARRVHEQDCTAPIADTTANLRCR